MALIRDRKNVFASAAALAAVLVFLLCGAGALGAGAPAVLIGASGEVEVRASGAGQWTAARVQATLNPGDSIRTKNGKATLLYPDGTQVKMNGFSALNVEGPDSAAGRTLDLTRGEIWAKVSKIGDGKTTVFTVKTPVAHCGVRGTELDIFVEETGGATLTVVDGEAEFSNEYGSVAVADSQQSTARPGGAPSPPRVVDYRKQIEWIADAYSLGLDVENPMLSEDPAELASYEETYLGRLSAAPGDAEALEYLGMVYYDQHRYGEALDTLLKADAAAPEKHWILVSLGQVYLDLADTEKAMQYFRKAVDLFKDAGEAATGVGLSYLKENRLEYAEDSLNGALKIKELPLTHVALAVVLMRQGRTEEARTHISRALELAPDFCQAYVALASLELSMNRLVEAFRIADGAARLNPFAAFPHSVLADVYLQRENPASARVHAMTTVALNPNDPFAHFSLGRVEKENAQFAASLRSFRKAVELSPDFERASAELAKLLADMGRVDEAVAEAGRMIALRPGYAPPYATLGDVYFAAGDEAKAEEYYRKAVELDPRSGDFHARIAMLFIETHDMESALDEIKRAIGLEPDNPWHHVYAGYIYDQIDNEDLATHHFRTAIELDPDNALAHAFFGTMMTNRAERYETFRKGIAETHLASLLDPRSLVDSSRRGRTEFTHIRGSLGFRDTRFRFRLRESDARFNLLASNTQLKTEGERINSERLTEFRQFQVGWLQSSKKSFSFHLQDVREYLGAPGPVVGRDDEGDPDDSTLVTFTEASAAFRYKPSRRTQFRFRLQSTLPTGSNESIWDNPLNFPPDAINQALPYEDMWFSERQHRKQVSVEAGYTRKWGRRNHELSVGAASFTGKFDIRDAVLAFDMDADPPVFYKTYVYFEQQINHFITYAQNKFFINPKFTLTASARRDGSAREGHLGGYKFVLSYKPSKRTWLHLRSQRSLDVFELAYYAPFEYWSFIDRIGEFTWGSRTLLHEADYEITFRDSSFLKLSFLQEEEENFKTYDTETLNYKVRMKCARVSYQRELASGVSFFLDYRYIPRKDRTAGTAYYGLYAADTNVHSRRIYLNYVRKNGFGSQLEAIHNSDKYFDRKNFIVRDGYVVWNLRMFYDPSLHRRYYLHIINLTDTDYEFKTGYPEPGRQYSFGMSRYF